MSTVTLKGFGLDTEVSNKCVNTQGGLTAALGFWQAVTRREIKLQEKANQRELEDMVFGLDSQGTNKWYGGTHSDLTDHLSGKLDMGRFAREKAKLESSGFGSKLVTGLANTMPKRIRRLHESCGEWSYERRWDDRPCMDSVRTLAPNKAIRIDAYSNALANVTAESLNTYGAKVWAISQLLETHGISTEVNLIYYSCNLAYSGGSPMDTRTSIRVKKFGEYIAPSVLAACCSTLFYRRLIFAIRALQADAIGSIYDAPRTIQQPAVSASPGVLQLAANAHKGHDDEIERGIIATLK